MVSFKELPAALRSAELQPGQHAGRHAARHQGQAEARTRVPDAPGRTGGREEGKGQGGKQLMRWQSKVKSQLCSPIWLGIAPPSSCAANQGRGIIRRRTPQPRDRTPRRRGRHLGHAGGQLRPHAPGNAHQDAGKVNQVIYWGRPLDWQNQTLTPNPDTLYSWCSSTRRSRADRARRAAGGRDGRSTPTSSTSGRCRWRMRACSAWTRARAASS